MTSSPTNCTEAERHTPGFAATWIENWPDAVKHLSFRQIGVPLSRPQFHALARKNGVFAHGFEEHHDDSLASLEASLDEALADFPGGAFVRLGSRSAKDTPTAILTGCRAERGRAIIALLTDGSRRVAYDLRLCLRNAYLPWIFLREWRDFHWSSEFRCFLLAGRLAGISQYHHALPFPGGNRAVQLARIPALVEEMVQVLQAARGLETAVFDVCMEETGKPAGTLIDINPWGPPTDACLFSWQRHDFDGSLRIQSRKPCPTPAPWLPVSVHGMTSSLHQD